MKQKLNIKQLIITIVIVLLLILVIAYIILAIQTYEANPKMVYGVTFSKKFSQHLKLDWQDNYQAILDDLQVKYIRIPTYWEDIEPTQDQYDFSAIDWQLDEAQKCDVKIVLVVGRRQPRWPECHEPDWVNQLSPADARARARKNIRVVVERYKDHPAVEMWQVENEPFLDFFGECPKMSKKELQEEIDIVRALDDRPILLTDSGELSSWYPVIKMGDYFGTTLYRITYNKYIGYWEYFFLPSSFYRVKAAIFGKQQQNLLIAELQAEPWFPRGPLETPIDVHYHSMNARQLIKNAEYAKKTNFARAYFWGAEWWYWLKTVHNDASVWQAAKKYF